MVINSQDSVIFYDETEFYLSYPLFLAYMLYGPYKNIKHISLINIHMSVHRWYIGWVQPTWCRISHFIYFCKTLYIFQTIFIIAPCINLISTPTNAATIPWLYSPCRTLASFTTIFQSSLLCARILQIVTPSSSGPPSRCPSTLTLVFLNSYSLLACSDITSLPPFPRSSSPHVPAISTTNAHTYNFYIKTFKIAPTCFDPKIIFRELHCSLLKSHF